MGLCLLLLSLHDLVALQRIPLILLSKLLRTWIFGAVLCKVRRKILHEGMIICVPGFPDQNGADQLGVALAALDTAGAGLASVRELLG